MANIHLVKDESIGGIQREYEEVRREVSVGDFVWLVNAECAIEVTEYSVDIANRQIISGDTKALDPTDIVQIDDKKYQLAERKAEVGEKVLGIYYDGYCFSTDGYEIGSVHTVLDVAGCDDDMFYVDTNFPESDTQLWLDTEEFYVLIPVDSEPAEPTPDIYDLMANLVTRVASLEMENKRIKQDLGWHETGPGRIANLRNSVSDLKHGIAQLEVNFEQDKRDSDDFADEMRRKVGELVRAKGSGSIESQLRDTQNNVERLAQDHENVAFKVVDIEQAIGSILDSIESNTKDIAFLDERTYEKPGKPTKSAEVLLRNISKLISEGGGVGDCGR